MGRLTAEERQRVTHLRALDGAPGARAIPRHDGGLIGRRGVPRALEAAAIVALAALALLAWQTMSLGLPGSLLETLLPRA